MNPLRWLLKKSAGLAERRGGNADPWAPSFDRTVDSREYECWLEISGAKLLVTNKKWPERWIRESENGLRLARVEETHRGGFRLTVYERRGTQWQPIDGPSVLASQPEAEAQALVLLANA